MVLPRSLAIAGAFAILLAGVTSDACAQQIFKITGPDGRVTFSDKPPLDSTGKAEAAKVVTLTPDGGTAVASLPFELRQAATRYPVTLYSSPGCQTCAQGRQLLVSRGIPFSERTVATREDIDALSRLAGTQTVPLLTIGGQQLKGYSDSEWAQFLDAAGYPKTSQLPASYIPSPATPLVALDQQRPAPGAAAPSTARQPDGNRRVPAQSPDQPAGENPAGIAF